MFKNRSDHFLKLKKKIKINSLIIDYFNIAIIMPPLDSKMSFLVTDENNRLLL